MPRNCPSCGRANDDDARFCSACAAVLVATCPSCGTTLPTDAVFCRACGAVVGAGAVNANAPALTGGEDFAFMMEQRPGAMIFIGNGVNPDGTSHQLHTPFHRFAPAPGGGR